MIITPEFGLFFWTLVIFLAFFFLLRRYAWKPIISALNERESSISEALEQAGKAREEMAKLQSDNEALLKEARQEREKILKEANIMKDQIVKEAKDAAAQAGAKEREKAKQQINAEKTAALAEIKNTAAQIAVEVAEKILRKEFENKSAQTSLAKTLIGELNNN